MPLYLITYDLRKVRNYQPLYATFQQWKASRILKSLWLAQLKGPTAAIRDILRNGMDSDDGLAVIELKPGSDWATYAVQPAGATWLKTYIHG